MSCHSAAEFPDPSSKPELRTILVGVGGAVFVAVEVGFNVGIEDDVLDEDEVGVGSELLGEELDAVDNVLEAELELVEIEEVMALKDRIVDEDGDVEAGEVDGAVLLNVDKTLENIEGIAKEVDVDVEKEDVDVGELDALVKAIA